MKQFYSIVLLALIGLLAVAGCSNDKKSEAKSEKRTPTSLQMAWTHEYFASGLYAAEKNGHFADAGLDVTLVEGGFGENGYIDPIDVVVNGTYAFGFSDAETLIRARAEGKPVVAIATIMQRSPSAIISLSKSSIQRPQDLVDHTVLVSDGGADHLFSALLKAQNIAPDSINQLPRTVFGIDPLLNGETDALMGWIINEGVEVQEAGESANMILLSDYGIDTYTLVVFSTDTVIKEKPELVEKMLRSILEGYQDVIANPAQAIDYTLTYNDSLDHDGQLRRLEAMIPLINIPGQNLGVMDQQVWEEAQTVLLDADSSTTPIDLQTVYTTAFLDKIYGKSGD